MLSQSFDHPLPSRNNSPVFWTETHHDPRVPCQWGTVSGLRVQQEADDGPVGSILKCLVRLDSRQVFSDWLTQGLMEYKNNVELCDSFGLCPCLPFFCSKSWILWTVLHSTQYNFCLLLNQTRKVTVLVLGGVYTGAGGLLYRDPGGLMHWSCADRVPLRTTSVEVSGTQAI